jgi:hypothetical protein
MTQELDPAIIKAEQIISDKNNHFVKVEINAYDFLNLHSFLIMTREIRRRQVKKDSVQEPDEDILSALESRFNLTEKQAPKPQVEMEISFREIQFLGKSIPQVESLVLEAKQKKYPLRKDLQTEIPLMTYEGFISLFDSFVAFGGKDDRDLRDQLSSWVSKFKNQN